MENNLSHKTGVNSTLYNAAIEGFSIISTHFYLNLSSLFFCEEIPICNLNIFFCFYQWAHYKILNLWCHVTSRIWV